MNLPHILHDRRTISTPIILFIVTFIIYLLSYRGEGKPYNYFVLLADAFLHGRLYLVSHPSWLSELINIGNHFYVPYPPMPAILLLPFILLFGTSFPQPLLSIFLGSINVSLCFIVISKLFKSGKIGILTSILYAFGTIQWYHAEVGSSWYIAQIIAMFFIWLSILELATKKRLFLIGLFIGLTFLSRIPVIFAFVFPLIYMKNFQSIKSYFFYAGGLSIGIILYLLYNQFSFGSPFNSGYWLIPNVLNEQWYRFGILSIKYIPEHIFELFTSIPVFSTSPPFIIPSLNVMSLWFTTPAFVLILKANFKNLLEKSAFFTSVLILIPILMHGSNGFSQFGYRFIMDLYPFLLILTASGIKNSNSLLIKVLIILSVLINLWGVLMISFFKIWTL